MGKFDIFELELVIADCKIADDNPQSFDFLSIGVFAGFQFHCKHLAISRLHLQLGFYLSHRVLIVLDEIATHPFFLYIGDAHKIRIDQFLLQVSVLRSQLVVVGEDKVDFLLQILDLLLLYGPLLCGMLSRYVMCVVER